MRGEVERQVFLQKLSGEGHELGWKRRKEPKEKRLLGRENVSLFR
jgi:hypothetical protein